MIGVLDLQGGVVEHLGHLHALGVPARRVRHPRELDGLAGLILPGGESTCLGKLLHQTGLDKAIPAAHARGLRLWGTCAGAILLAKTIEGEKPHLALLDIAVRRNAYGSQLDSFTAAAEVPPEISPAPVPLVFIRAPVITRTGPGVRVLLAVGDRIAAAADDAGGMLATVFHPELSPSLAFHGWFARLCGLDVPSPEALRGDDAAWSRESWTKLAARPGR